MSTCPGCEVDADQSCDAIAYFALGVTIGASFIDPSGVTDLMCVFHRKRFEDAMRSARSTAMGILVGYVTAPVDEKREE